MKFDVTQHFDADAERVIAVYSAAETYEQLPEFGKISRPVLLDRSEHGDTVTMRLRYRFTADLPTAALAVIDPDRLTWIEETRYDLAALTATTKLLPDHYASKLEASASARFADRGEGSTRAVAGSLKVHMFLVAGQVEKAIVSGLKEHLDEEAQLVAELLA
ncbi:MAG: DUF2505 family protein [Acidimicrobiales bacterium]